MVYYIFLDMLILYLLRLVIIYYCENLRNILQLLT